jgi:D-alanyl-lipoteichoic acid acyltransferase DltB (MBOAT superfamily)
MRAEAEHVMLFNSTVFLKFLAAFLLGYYLVRHRLRVRNLLIVVASYVFYGWWDWRFLSLIFISTVLDYAVALGLERAEGVRRRKGLLALSLCGNLGILGFFKYYDFFATSLASLFARAGVPFNPGTLGINCRSASLSIRSRP